MTVTVKNKTKSPLVVPPAVRRKAGFKGGQELEFRASGGVVTIVPKPPSADDEYTPEERRVIDARLSKSLEEVKQGHTAGPFDTADGMIDSLKRELKKSRGRKTKPSTR